MLLPALAAAIRQQQRCAALRHHIVVPGAAQAHPVLPGGGLAQLRAGQGGQPSIRTLVTLRHAGDHLSVVVEEAVVLIERGKLQGAVTGRFRAGAGHIAQHHAPVLVAAAAMAAAGIVAGGLADVHIAPVLHTGGVIAVGDLAHQSADIVAGDGDAAVGIAVPENAAALIAQQTAYGAHRHGALQGHGHIAGIAVLDQAGRGIAHQSAGIKDLTGIHICEHGVHRRAALNAALDDIARQQAHVTAACHLTVPQAHIFHHAAAVAEIDHAAIAVSADARRADDHILHQQVPDLSLFHPPDEEGRFQVLQTDAADDMLLSVQLTGEFCAGIKGGGAAVEDDALRQYAGVGKINILRQLIVPAHVVIDPDPVGGGGHLLPELNVLGGILLLDLSGGAAIVVLHARDLIAAGVGGLFGVDLHIEYYIVQAVRRHTLVYHAGYQAVNGHTGDRIVSVIAHTQLDIAPFQLVGVFTVRPVVAHDLGRRVVAQHRQGDILLILLHANGQIQPGIEAHRHTSGHIKGAAQDLLLPTDIVKLVDIAVVGGAGVVILSRRQRPCVAVDAGGRIGAGEARRVRGQQIGAAFVLAHLIVVAHAVAVGHTLELAAAEPCQQTGLRRRRRLIPAVQQHIDIADAGLLVAGAEKTAALVASGHKASAVLAVDIAVFHEAAVAGHHGAKLVARGLCHQIAAQLHDEVP